MLKAMEEKGLSTAADLSRLTGVGQVVIGKYINLLESPYSSSGGIKPSAEKISVALNVCIRELFPDANLYEPLSKNVVEIEADKGQLMLESRALEPDLLMDRESAFDMIARAVDGLPEREAYIINSWYGLNDHFQKTMEELSDEMNISPVRVAQIKRRGEQRMKPQSWNSFGFLEEAKQICF